MADVVIVGTGGHAKVVADAVACAGTDRLIGFAQDEPGADGFLGLPVRAPGDWRDRNAAVAFVVAVGENAVRARLAGRLAAGFGAPFATVVHPRATVARSATLGPGTVVMAGAVINPFAKVGGHVIVNTNATLEHDCAVADFATLAPGAVMCGGCAMGEGAFLGANACLRQGLSMAEWSVGAAGAMIVADVPANSLVAGVPARLAGRRDRDTPVYRRRDG